MVDLLFWFLISFLWWIFLSSFAVSAGLHRYFSHRSFQAPLWYEYAVLILAPFSGSGSVLGWVGVHRLHHKYADTDRDPHSPRHVGFLRVVTSTFKVPAIPPRIIADLLRNERVVFFHKHHLRIRLSLIALGALSLPTIPFFIFFITPMIYGYLGFGLLNALCHRDGQVVNSWVANLFTGGDGWHANHHQDSQSPRIGQQWWQVDPGWWTIQLIGKPAPK